MADPSLTSSTTGARPAATAEGSGKRRGTRRRFWLLLLLIAGTCLLLTPRPWHAALRTLLAWRAARGGYSLEIAGIEGGLFDSTELFGVRCSPRWTGAEGFQIARAGLVFGWRVPWLQRPGPWVRQLTLSGLTGTVDFTPEPNRPPSAWIADGWPAAVRIPAQVLGRPLEFLAEQLDRFDDEFIPGGVEVRADHFTIARGLYRASAQGLILTALHEDAGWIVARGLAVSGPKFSHTMPATVGSTLWKRDRFTLSGMDLGGGVRLAAATLSDGHLNRNRVDWEAELTALGGTARGQGSVNFSHPRLALEVAGSLEKISVAPLASLLDMPGGTDGRIEQANFTFRGDPEDWPGAEMWLAGQATDFRWGGRRWESLEVRGVVLHRRMQVYRLELRQSRNRLSFTGECALPRRASEEPPPGAPDLPWWQAGFSCDVDARIEDLHAFAQLAGGGLPELAGRMSVNGKLSARPGDPGIDGYLNVEGSELSIRGAPLDYLRATLAFKSGELQVKDLQATHGGDYLSGKGIVRIVDTPRYQAELRVAVKDLAVYAPAYGDLPFSSQPLSGSLTLQWSGDGTPGADSGAFHGSVEHFVTRAGPAALGRPLDLAVDGTYSPESLSFRQFVLREGDGAKRHDLLKMEGALPWTRDPRALAAGRWLEPARPMAVRIECTDVPLDLLAVVAPRDVRGAGGQVTGWIDATGLPRAPKLDGVLNLKNAALIWNGGLSFDGVDAAVHLASSVLHIDQARGNCGSGTFQAEGTVDLRDLSNLALDLALKGQDPDTPRGPAFDAGMDYSLHWTGAAADGFSISGDVALVDAHWRRRLDGLAESTSATLFPDWIERGEYWMPASWLDWGLDLHVTGPVRLTGDPAGGKGWPDFQVTGSGRSPRVNGTLTLANAGVLLSSGAAGVANGVLCFAADEPDNPMITLRVQPPPNAGKDHADPSAEVFFYGARDSGRTVSWDAPPEPGAASIGTPGSLSIALDMPPAERASPNAMAAFADADLPESAEQFLSFR